MNNLSKSIFIFSFIFLANQTLMLHGMDTSKSLNTQCLKEKYKVSNYLPQKNTTSKKNPRQRLEIYFRQYAKQMKCMNIPWFNHIYKTKERAKLNAMGRAISYKQKKIVFQGYELAPNAFTKFFLVGAFTAPWLYACFGK